MPISETALSPEDAIGALRRQIDALDRDIFALLKERSERVREVGAVKKASHPHGCFIRPAREAEMLRALPECDVGAFPLPHLAAIWRLLIAGSTSIEQNLSAAVLVSSQQRDFFWLAREYFGPSIAITCHQSSGHVVADVVDGKSRIGFLPVPQESNETEHWWTTLARRKAGWPKVFAVAPFLRDKRVPQALLIGDVVLESTGQDATLVVVETKGRGNRTKQSEVFKELGIKAKWLAEARAMQDEENFCYLYELDGAMHPDHAIYAALRAIPGQGVVEAMPIGIYAKPMKL